jgi:DEAD/DEAH box helicase domain-containing protein
MESFIAAFLLGMREYFGNVDHLRHTVTTAPLAGEECRKQFLIIYDSVPGGTGYLKQLALEEHSLIKILEKSLNFLETCDCRNDPQKDGCYRCLFSYRQSRSIGRISRKAAINLLRQIYSGKDSLVESQRRITEAPVDDLLESELERLFIDALSRTGDESRKVALSNQLVRDKAGFRLKIRDAVWEIEPQVTLGREDGVSVQTKADFVLWPIGPREDRWPVAIYTDGFAFHSDSVADDTLKRAALLARGGLRVWTLNWQDVRFLDKKRGESVLPALDVELMPGRREAYRTISKIAGRPDFLLPEPSPMELLVRYLESPKAETVFANQAKAVAYALLSPGDQGERAAFDEWLRELSEIREASGADGIDYEFGKTLFGTFRPEPRSAMRVLAGLAGKSLEDIEVISFLDDLEFEHPNFKRYWSGFWHFWNLMQFSNNFRAVTRLGLQEGIYEQIVPIAHAPFDAPDSGWMKALKLIAAGAARDFADRCVSLGIPPPDEVGFELIGEDGAVAGEAEMAWETTKIALLLSEETSKAFSDAGWRIIYPRDEPNLDWFKGD